MIANYAHAYNILNNHHTGNIDWVGLSEYKPYLPTGLTLPPSAFTEERLKENNLAFFIIGNKKEKKGKGLYNAIISAFKKVTALTTTIMDKESLIDECTQQKGCIKSLKITAHGHGSLAHAVLYTSKEEIWENIDKEEISDMLGSFVFCKKCYIELIACNIGKYELLKERIIKKTGCTVKLYDFKVPALVEVYRWFGNTDEEIKKFSEDISK